MARVDKANTAPTTRLAIALAQLYTIIVCMFPIFVTTQSSFDLVAMSFRSVVSYVSVATPAG